MRLIGTEDLQTTIILLSMDFLHLGLDLPQIVDTQIVGGIGYNTGSSLFCQQLITDNLVIHHHLG